MTAPKGYRFASTYSGIRKDPDEDLTLIVSDPAANAAGVFTQNLVRAAPVTESLAHLAASKGVCRAIVANAGNANCATPTMNRVARLTARAAAKLLGVGKEQILLASTGVIGEPLNETLIVDALPELANSLSPEGLHASARAIMTTDTFPKTALGRIKTKQGEVRLCGIAKGAGMIHPNMATMLSFLLTDAAIDVRPLNKMLRDVVKRTFNRISVDSDTSTNDTVFLLANGASGVKLSPADRVRFERVLYQTAEQLAVGIVADGEGSRRVMTIDVEGASSEMAAERLARAIANSPLVKTALAGADPNWGRFLSAAGAAGVEFEPSKADIYINGVRVCRGGLKVRFSEEEVSAGMRQDECSLRFRIRGGGKGKARFWTCDLTEEYVRINADYRT